MEGRVMLGGVLVFFVMLSLEMGVGNFGELGVG